jgi:hypothetical protein
VKKDELERTCSTRGRDEECIQGFGGKARRKEPLGTPGYRWEDNIKMDCREIGWGSANWIHLAEDRNYMLL